MMNKYIDKQMIIKLTKTPNEGHTVWYRTKNSNLNYSIVESVLYARYINKSWHFSSVTSVLAYRHMVEMLCITVLAC
jgi:hypothetical protein